MILRPNQLKLKQDISKALAKKPSVLMVAPTGFGKTVTFTDIALGAHKKETKTLLLTDRKEILDQIARTFKRQNLPCTTLTPETKVMPTSGIVVAMAQTLSRRMIKFLASFDPCLVIVDEAHEGIFTNVLKKLPYKYLIGATATPVGKHLFGLYDTIVESDQIPKLIELGFLVKPKSKMMGPKVEAKTKMGEYETSSMFIFYDKPTLYQGVVNKWLEEGLNRRTLVYCVNVEHAEKTAEAFGSVARCITSKTSKADRKKYIEGHQSGEFPVLVNCGILTKGYDDPKVEIIIVNRATKSLPLWLQMCGRGGRISEGKILFEIWDFGGNFERHGLWQQERVWKLEPPKKKRDTVGASPVIKCPECEAMHPMNVSICEYCGHVFSKEKAIVEGVWREVEPVKDIGVLVSQASIGQLIEAEKRKLLKATFVWRVLRDRGESWLSSYASVKGYSDYWVIRQLENGDTNFKDRII